MISLKNTLGIAASVCFATLSATEIYAVKSPADFNNPKQVQAANGVFSVKGTPALITAKKIAIDPAKKYKLSGEARQKSGKKVKLFIALNSYAANGREIFPCNFNEEKNGTFTELAAPLKKGDTVAKVKDASKWNNNTPYASIAFNAKEDYSDAPNFDVAQYQKGGIAKKGNVWEVTLKKPAAKDYAAGTKVRVYNDASTYLYCCGLKDLTDAWVVFSGTVSGYTKNKMNTAKFRPGTKTVTIIIFGIGGDSTSAYEFRNVKFEEVK